MAGLPKLESGSIDFLLNIFEGKCRIADKKYYFHTDSHQSFINMNIILLIRVLVDIFFKYKFEKRKDDILPDFFSLSIKIFLTLLINDFDMLHYFCLIRSINDLTLIQQLFELSVFLVDIVKHLHTHCYGSLADELYFHCWGRGQYCFRQLTYVDSFIDVFGCYLLFIDHFIVENTMAAEILL